MSSETITRNDLTNIINEIFPATTEDMTQAQIDAFITSLDVTSKNLVDYIVEEGTDGDWIYRKWNSGKAECWGHWSIGAFAPTSSFGGTYYRTLDKAFPSGLFNTEPTAWVDAYWDTGLSWASSRIITYNNLQYALYKNSNSSYGANVRAYAFGTWK